MITSTVEYYYNLVLEDTHKYSVKGPSPVYVVLSPSPVTYMIEVLYLTTSGMHTINL